MIRYLVLFVAVLAAAPCFAATPPPSAAVTTSQPALVARPTCPPPNSPPYALFNAQDKDALEAARRSVIAFAAAADGFAVCLNRALAVLQDDWNAAHAEPGTAVELAVANAIVTWQDYKRGSISDYNWVIHAYNAALPPGSAEVLAPLDMLLAAPDAPVAQAAAGRLNLPSYGILGTHNCSDFYPPESRILLESGNTLIMYDVAVSGAVQNARIVRSSGIARLDDAAMSCVSHRWQNAPAIANGVPIAVSDVQAVVVFSLH